MKRKENTIPRGKLIIVDWVDPTTFSDISEFEMLHPSNYLTPTKNVGFFVAQDKDSIMLSNMSYGEGKMTKFDNVTLIPKTLIKNIAIAEIR